MKYEQRQIGGEIKNEKFRDRRTDTQTYAVEKVIKKLSFQFR